MIYVCAGYIGNSCVCVCGQFLMVEVIRNFWDYY